MMLVASGVYQKVLARVYPEAEREVSRLYNYTHIDCKTTVHCMYELRSTYKVCTMWICYTITCA